jgi:hypothetical protein
MLMQSKAKDMKNANNEFRRKYMIEIESKRSRIN